MIQDHKRRIAEEVDLPSPCTIPTSELGAKGMPARIVARWRNNVAVIFEDGSRGQYTVSRHAFLPVQS